MEAAAVVAVADIVIVVDIAIGAVGVETVAAAGLTGSGAAIVQDWAQVRK